MSQNRIENENIETRLEKKIIKKIQKQRKALRFQLFKFLRKIDVLKKNKNGKI